MNKLLAAVLISSLIVTGYSAAVACTTPASGFHNTWDTTSATGSNCVAASAGCNYAYSDLTSGVPTSGSIVADCTWCAVAYSDVAPAAGVNTAATTAGAVAACSYCAPNYFFDRLSALATARCITKTLTGTNTCATG